MTKRLIFSVAAAGCVLLPAVGAAQTAGGGSGRGATPPGIERPGAVDLKQGPQAFSVVLVVGEMGNAGGVDNVPPAARKALNDMRDFLPYKSYRLLDTQWTLCCGRDAIYSRLRGIDDQEYELHLKASFIQSTGLRPPVVDVQTFWLSEVRTNAAQLDALRRQVEERRKARGTSDDEVRALEADLAAASRRSGNPTIMNTSFRMEVGETVVVGTSRIQGDRALIALLTAVPPKGASPR